MSMIKDDHCVCVCDEDSHANQRDAAVEDVTERLLTKSTLTFSCILVYELYVLHK